MLADRAAIPAPEAAFPVTPLQGDLADPAFTAELSAIGFDSLFHLASQLTFQTEQDPDGGFAANVAPLQRLIAGAARRPGPPPVVVFASSIACFGGDLPEVVGDGIPHAPQTTYGAHKAIIELLLADASRTGRIDGRSLRLPIVLTRPGAPVPAVSDQVAEILRGPLAGRDVTAPLAPDTKLPLASAGAVVAALLRLHALPAAALPPRRAFNLPALTVTAPELAEAAARAGGPGGVRFASDPALQRVVEGWPARFASETAARLGIHPEESADALARDHLEDPFR